MKQYLIFVALVFVIISCGDNQTDVPEIQSEIQKDTLNDIPLVDPDQELLTVDTLLDNNLESFPKHWVEVKVKHKEIIYTDYCNMGHPHWKLMKNDSIWQIETFYGQDGELWNVQNMTANIQSADDQIFQEGIFVVTKETYPDNEIYEVSYFWNQTAGFCMFGEFFSKETQFADYSHYDSFKVVEEDCDLP